MKAKYYNPGEGWFSPDQLARMEIWRTETERAMHKGRRSAQDARMQFCITPDMQINTSVFEDVPYETL